MGLIVPPKLTLISSSFITFKASIKKLPSNEIRRSRSPLIALIGWVSSIFPISEELEEIFILLPSIISKLTLLFFHSFAKRQALSIPFNSCFLLSVMIVFE